MILKDLLKCLYHNQHIEIYIMSEQITFYGLAEVFIDDDNKIYEDILQYKVRTIEIKRDDLNKLKDIIKIIISNK